MQYVRELAHVTAVNPGNTVSVPVAVNASPGDTVVLSVAINSTARLSSVHDTKGNTWTYGAEGGGAANSVNIFSTPQDAGTLTTGDTITLTLNASNATGVVVVVHEFSGIGVLDQVAAATATGTARDAGTASPTTNANDLIYAAFGVSAVETSFAPGAGGVTPVPAYYINNTSSPPISLEVEYEFVSTTGTYNPTATGGASAASVGATVIFKASTLTTISKTGGGVSQAVTGATHYRTTQLLGLSLSSAKQPNFSGIGGSTYGVGTYGLGTYGSAHTNVYLNIRARCNPGDSGSLWVAIWSIAGFPYETGTFLTAPFAPSLPPLTSNWTTYTLEFSQAASVQDWSQLVVYILGFASGQSPLTLQVSWVDLNSVNPPGIAKVGGAISKAVAGGVHLKAGGTIAPTVSGAAKAVTAAKVGGTVSQAIGGGVEAISQPAFTAYPKTGGTISQAIAGGTKTARTIKTGGTISNAVAGGVHSQIYSHVGGGISKAITGGARSVLQLRIGGTISTAISGATHKTSFIKTGGGISLSITGGVRSDVIYKKGGGSLIGTIAGASKSVISVSSFISKIGGVVGASLAGGTRSNTNNKTGGVVALLVAGGSRGVVRSFVGGAISNSAAGGNESIYYVCVGGGVSTPISGAVHFARFARKGGAISISISGGTKGYSSNKRAGAIAPLQSGGNKSKLIITLFKSQFGGAVSLSNAGTSKAIFVVKTGGSVTSSVAGLANGKVCVTSRGGGIASTYAGGQYNFTGYKSGGGVSRLYAGGTIRTFDSKSGGGVALTSSGTVVGSVVKFAKFTGGSTSNMVSGASEGLLSSSHTAGAISQPIAGATTDFNTFFEMLGPMPTHVLSTKFSYWLRGQ